MSTPDIISARFDEMLRTPDTHTSNFTGTEQTLKEDHPSLLNSINTRIELANERPRRSIGDVTRKIQMSMAVIFEIVNDWIDYIYVILCYYATSQTPMTHRRVFGNINIADLFTAGLLHHYICVGGGAIQWAAAIPPLQKSAAKSHGCGTSSRSLAIRPSLLHEDNHSATHMLKHPKHQNNMNHWMNDRCVLCARR